MGWSSHFWHVPGVSTAHSGASAAWGWLWEALKAKLRNLVFVLWAMMTHYQFISYAQSFRDFSLEMIWNKTMLVDTNTWKPPLPSLFCSFTLGLKASTSMSGDSSQFVWQLHSSRTVISHSSVSVKSSECCCEDERDVCNIPRLVSCIYWHCQQELLSLGWEEPRVILLIFHETEKAMNADRMDEEGGEATYT